MILRNGLDGEARAQIGRPLLVGDRLVPDVHAPVVGRNVEKAGVLAVGHGHPVLSAQEAGAGEDGRSLGRLARRAGAVGVVVIGPAVLVEAVGRSEEHTSELQSLMRISYAVFCLTKKKNRQRRYSDD